MRNIFGKEVVSKKTDEHFESKTERKQERHEEKVGNKVLDAKPEKALDALRGYYEEYAKKELEKKFRKDIKGASGREAKTKLTEKYEAEKKALEARQIQQTNLRMRLVRTRLGLSPKLTKQEQAQAIDKRIEGLEDKKVKQGGKPTTEQANELRDLKAAKGIIENSPDAQVRVGGKDLSIGGGQRHIFNERIGNVMGAGESAQEREAQIKKREEREAEIRNLTEALGQKQLERDDDMSEEQKKKIDSEIKDIKKDIKVLEKQRIEESARALNTNGLKKVGDAIEAFVAPSIKRAMPSMGKFRQLKVEWLKNEENDLKKKTEDGLNEKLLKENRKFVGAIKYQQTQGSFMEARFDPIINDIKIRRKEQTPDELFAIGRRRKEDAWWKWVQTTKRHEREWAARREQNKREKEEPWINDRISEYAKAQKVISLLLARMSETVQWGDTGQRKQKMEDDKQGLVVENKKGEEEIKNFEIEKSGVAKERQALEDEKKGKKYEDIKNDISIQSREIDIAKREEEIDNQIASLKEKQEQRTTQIDTLDNSIKTAGDSYKRETENDGLSDFFEKNPNAGQDWIKIKQAMELQEQIKESFRLDMDARYRHQVLLNGLNRDLLDFIFRNFLDMVRAWNAPIINAFKGQKSSVSLGRLTQKAGGLFEMSNLANFGVQTLTAMPEFIGKELFMSLEKSLWSILLCGGVMSGITWAKRRHLKPRVKEKIKEFNEGITFTTKK